jgi:hypothetical protein
MARIPDEEIERIKRIDRDGYVQDRRIDRDGYVQDGYVQDGYVEDAGRGEEFFT